ncbi:MAG TPA: uroporphyrinogen decarboxylase family protein [Methylomirabilota bacterium]|nr:uroporphyrinogen decarboxylase family protein [Methylomirabilota bacterium]
MLVRDHQLLEGGSLAGAQPVQEARRVACLRLSHGKTIPRPRSSRVEMPVPPLPSRPDRRGRLRAIMTKRERVLSAARRGPVDRPPVSFWRHVPDVDHTAAGLADAMLAFQRKWDLDFVKVMSSGVYCVEDWGCRVAYQGSPNGAKQCTEHGVRERKDWARVRPLDEGAGALGRELEAVRLVARGRADDAPILHTLFSPLTVARKLAGDRMVADLRAEPGAVEPALDAIADTMARHARAALDAGADGLFFATQAAVPDVLTEEETARFELPRMRRILDAVGDRSALTLLHVHGRDVYFDRAAALPVHAMNWHDRLTTPGLGDGHRRFAGAVVGGLSEHRTLQAGPPDAVAAEVRDAIAQTGGRGVIIGPGCVLPLATPDAHLAAVVAAVKTAG